MAAATWLRCSVFSPLVSGTAHALVVIVFILLVICLSHWHFVLRLFHLSHINQIRKMQGCNNELTHQIAFLNYRISRIRCFLEYDIHVHI